MSNGYVKLYRSILEWEWWADPNAFRVFMFLLLRANFKQGRFMGRIIPAGSLVTSVNKIASETNLTSQQIRTALDKLQSTHEINKQTTSKYTVITICNWEKYQSDNKQITNEQQTNNKQITTIEEGKKGRREYNNINTGARDKVKLDDLSTEHIKGWLMDQRANGKYLHHDENEVLDVFRNYCKSKGKVYKDYVAAYRNAFGWERFSAKQQGQLTKTERTQQAAIRGMQRAFGSEQ